MELQLEPLDQQVLQHLEKLLLGGFRGKLGFCLKVESLIAPLDPIGAGFEHQHGDVPGDANHVAKARVGDDAAAEGRGLGLLGRSINRIDAVAAAANAIRFLGERV
jgi:hypothetical protein